MNPQEAGQLLLLMQGTWPRLASDEVAARMWVEDLTGMESKPALFAFRSLRDSQDRAPAWSLFLEAYRAEARRLAPRELASPDDGWVRPTEEQKAVLHDMVVELKQYLTGRKSVLDAKLVHPSGSQRTSTTDALEPMLSYDEVYETEAGE